MSGYFDNEGDYVPGPDDYDGEDVHCTDCPFWDGEDCDCDCELCDGGS